MNPPVIPTSNLDNLPFPDLRDIKNIPAYFTPFFSKGPMTTMMATRGCPFSCSFCDVHANMGKKYRTRSPENLIDEIMFHKKASVVNNFYFKDSIFTLHKENTIEFCELSIKKNLKINWICNSRVNTMDSELAKLMARSGCKIINFGVESMDPAVLEFMKKKVQFEEVKKCLYLCRKAGIATTAYMMVGSEGETYQSYMNGLKELIKLNPTLGSFSVTKAYPGTQLHREALSKGLLKDAKWYNNFEKQNGEAGHLNLPDFPVKEQQKTAKESYEFFYFRPFKVIELLRIFFSFQFVVLGVKFVLRNRLLFPFLTNRNQREFPLR